MKSTERYIAIEEALKVVMDCVDYEKGNCRQTLTSANKCSVYFQRPLICRLWGTVKKMACPHGCQPTTWLSDQEAGLLIQKMEEVGL